MTHLPDGCLRDRCRRTADKRAPRRGATQLDPTKLGFSERAIRKLPAARALLPEGDFRDWTEIDAWATASPAT